jgi:phosphonatase-like hydrolase
MSQKISLVMFDMSGTTIKDYNEVMDCFLEAAEFTGIVTNPVQINTMMGWSKIDVFRELWKSQMSGADQTAIETESQKSFQLFCQVLEQWYATHDIEPSEGTIDTFQWLRDHHIKIALGTGFYRKVTDIILKKLGWMDGLDDNYINMGNAVIDFSISSDQVDAGRPHAAMIHKTMSVFGIENALEIIKIGDTPSDLQEGRNAHCFRTFGITNGTHSHDELSKFPSDGLFPNMAAFKEYLASELS